MSKDIHDISMKFLMAQRSFFIAFCKVYLPTTFRERIQWDSLKLHKANGEFIKGNVLNEGQRHKEIADIIYLMKYDQDKTGMLYAHIEHWSTPKKLSALKTFNYGTSALLEYAESNDTDELPALVSMIYYHGKRTPFPFKTKIADMFETPKEAIPALLEPVFIDVGQMTDDEILSHKEISPAELVFKHAFDKKLTDQSLQLIFSHVHDMNDNSALTVLQYSLETLERDPNEIYTAFITQKPNLKEKAMTAAQQLRTEGMQQGVQQGVDAMMSSLKEQGIDPAILAKAKNDALKQD